MRCHALLAIVETGSAEDVRKQSSAFEGALGLFAAGMRYRDAGDVVKSL
jgi:hypothetical protein